MSSPTKKIILFDGICNLCNGAIQFIIKRDTQNLFLFTPLQSKAGKKLLEERKIDTKNMDSILLIDPNVAYYIKSDAALEIVKNLSTPWRFIRIFKVLPIGFRDFVYDFIAKNRYRWFGKEEQCMIPTPELKTKFLD
ncbi:putative DCC family thiol-disulfide oxidoreductase YuxK [Maribacter vaceletii]|uniref:Putative DCC family thiol-disulfide oxidoreductase YuxK n=1 Tax=Maribacter vaceletii TaxID=1206816 RepID=A0A495E9A1_9FLAO|nr:thiol-disulfide oxidoreductase DCC family protein [Maribacter vaceletii]RKR13159.1 putative DCC family thiol-disulfide oxidoreductase YuxK [Maribacter vaceletii]